MFAWNKQTNKHTHGEEHFDTKALPVILSFIIDPVKEYFSHSHVLISKSIEKKSSLESNIRPQAGSLIHCQR